MKALKIILVLSLLPLFQRASAEDINILFRKGNDFYKKQEYDSAVKSYGQILAEGYETPEVYFNIGNAYYRKNNIVRSILFYERAKKLSSGDEDIHFNLRLANLNVIDKIESIPQLFYKRWWTGFMSVVSADGWALLSVTACLLAAISAIFFALSVSPPSKRFFFFSGILLLFIVALSWICAQNMHNELVLNKQAVIVSPSVYVKSSPDIKGTDLFILHEGVKVDVIDQVGDWQKIKLGNGNEGWAEANAMEAI